MSAKEVFIGALNVQSSAEKSVTLSTGNAKSSGK